jgi:predicted secreted protein
MTPLGFAQLACGCRVTFRDADPKAGDRPGSPVTVVLERKAATCTLALHVAGMAIYDHRSALRPSTRSAPHVQPDYEEN